MYLFKVITGSCNTKLEKKTLARPEEIFFLGNEELWIPPLNSFGLVVSVLKVLPYYSSIILYLPIAVGFHNVWKEMLRQGSYHPNKNNRDIFFKKKNENYCIK